MVETRLEAKITADTSKFVQAIKEAQKALGALKKAEVDTTDASEDLEKSVEEVNKTVEETKEKTEETAEAVDDMGETFERTSRKMNAFEKETGYLMESLGHFADFMTDEDWQVPVPSWGDVFKKMSPDIQNITAEFAKFKNTLATIKKYGGSQRENLPIKLFGSLKLIGALKTGVQGVAQMFKQAFQNASEFAQMWNSRDFAKATEQKELGIKKLKTALGAFTSPIVNGINKAIGWLAEALSKVFKYIYAGIKWIAEFWIAVFQPVIDAVQKAVEAIKKGITWLIDKIKSGINAIANFFGKDDIFKATANGAEDAAKNIEEVGDAAKYAEGNLLSFDKLTTMDANTGDQDTIDSMKETAEAWGKAGKSMGEAFSKLFSPLQWIKNIDWGGIGEKIKGGFDYLVSGQLWADLKDKAGNLWGSITEFGGQAWDKITKFGGTAWDWITTKAGNVWNTITGFSGNIWSSFTNFAKEAWDNVVRLANNVWNTITGFFGDIWTSFKTKAKEGWDGVVGFASEAWNRIKEFFGDLWSNFKDYAKEAWDNVLNFASEIKDKIFNFFANFWDNFVNGAKQAWDKFLEIGKKIIDQVVALVDKILGPIIRVLKALGVIKDENQSKGSSKSSSSNETVVEEDTSEHPEGYLPSGVFSEELGGHNDYSNVMNSAKSNPEYWNGSWTDAGMEYLDRKEAEIKKAKGYVGWAAKGDVIRPTDGLKLRMVGDNKQETEVISPLSTIRQAVGEALQMYGGTNGGGGGDITLMIDTKVLARVAYDDFVAEARRRGQSIGGTIG